MTWRASTHIHPAVVSDCGSLPDQPYHLTSFPQFPHLWCGGIGYLSHSVAAGTKLDVRRKASVWSTVCARHVNVRVWSTEKTFRMTSKFQGVPPASVPQSRHRLIQTSESRPLGCWRSHTLVFYEGCLAIFCFFWRLGKFCPWYIWSFGLLTFGSPGFGISE